MRKVIYLALCLAVLSGCAAYDFTAKTLNNTGNVISNVLSGGKVHITLGIETDAAYNDKTEP